MNKSTENHQSLLVAQIVDSIPGSDDGAISLLSLCRTINDNEIWCNGVCVSLIPLLQIFDSISIININDPDGPKVKARSKSAHYFLKSLAAYIREGRTIVSNWERPGIGEGRYSIHEVLSGPQFLYFMEQRRTADQSKPTAIRHAIVVKALIKAKVRGTPEPVILVQYDATARQYQLIGGHKRSTDPDVETAVRRELEEELSHNILSAPLNYELRLLNSISTSELSRTYGVYTDYDLFYFQVLFKTNQLQLGPNDYWVTLKELLSKKTRKGVAINENAIIELDKLLPGGLLGLGLSLNDEQHRSLSQLIRDHPWEAIGIALGILGILITIILFFLSR